MCFFQEMIRSVMEKIQIKLVCTILPPSEEKNLMIPGCDNPGLNNNNVVINKHSIIHYRDDEPMALDKIEELAQAETPTDVGDIHFWIIFILFFTCMIKHNLILRYIRSRTEEIDRLDIT